MGCPCCLFVGLGDVYDFVRSAKDDRALCPEFSLGPERQHVQLSGVCVCGLVRRLPKSRGHWIWVQCGVRGLSCVSVVLFCEDVLWLMRCSVRFRAGCRGLPGCCVRGIF